MQQQLLVVFALCFGVTSCKGQSSDPCAEAKPVYMSHVRQKQAEALATVNDAADRAKLEQEGNAELDRADARFLGVCKELGGAKVLACTKKAHALEAAKDPAAASKLHSDPDCASLGPMQAKLYAP